MIANTYAHIEVGADGVARISGTQTKVLEVALDRLAHRWDADEIHRQHPHLSLGQIHSALAYYYDHQEEIDRAIEERARKAREIKAGLGPSPLRARLQDQGSIP